VLCLSTGAALLIGLATVTLGDEYGQGVRLVEVEAVAALASPTSVGGTVGAGGRSGPAVAA